jgi:hypothetical protein
MITLSTKRWLGAASGLAVLALLPQAAHASDDYSVYSTRSQFEAALGAGNFTVLTPTQAGDLGVGYSTASIGNTISAPITYAPGAAGNLFGNTYESLGYTQHPADLGELNMTLPPGFTAFGFDFRVDPTVGLNNATFAGTFCTDIVVTVLCDNFETAALGPNQTFIGVIASAPIQGATITGTADNLQVARLTLNGSVAVVPEPGTVVLLGSGIAALAGFALARRRRQSLLS